MFVESCVIDSAAVPKSRRAMPDAGEGAEEQQVQRRDPGERRDAP